MRTVIFLSGPSGAGKTRVARRLAVILPRAGVIEVDDIKTERYGSSACCVPDEDFPEAGRRAAAFLTTCEYVVIVEAFSDEAHVRLVDQEIPNGVRRLHALLWCNVEDAVKRKGNGLPEAVVRSVHSWFEAGNYQHRKRFDTSLRQADEIAEDMADWVRATPSDAGADDIR